MRRRRLWAFRAVSLVASTFAAFLVLIPGLVLWNKYVNPPLNYRLLGRLGVVPRVDYMCYAVRISKDCEPTPTPDPNLGDWILVSGEGLGEQIPLERLAETPWCLPMSFNSNGLRDREYDPRPGPGVLRILGLGDSFAFGQGVSDDQTLFRQIVRALGPSYEIINGAKCGMYTTDELAAAQELLPKYHPDCMLVVWLRNDLTLSPELTAELNDIGRRYLERKKADRTTRGLSEIDVARDLMSLERKCIQPEHNVMGFEVFRRSLNSFASIPNCKVAFALYPHLDETLGVNYDFAAEHARIADMIREAGMPVLDLAPFFKGQRISSLWVHDEDHHPNAQADAIAARAIVDWIRSGGAGFPRPDSVRRATTTSSRRLRESTRLN